MSIHKGYILSALILPVLLAGCERAVSFNDQVMPILQASCVSCHSGSGEGAQLTELNLTSYAQVMQGTRLGAIVVPGSAASSTLYLVIDHKVDTKIQMPPHHDDKFPQGEGEPLSSDEIATIKRWIDEGAKNN
ncbi:c-type cytochrome domain-containing protein [uncultured Shewanella sp.]|uniref:c-type cytochrome domain-containing protein n=1 Tax=Shewanella atlantica TaxID=271099 RepID=UPI002613DF27|nr:c-type cytochrome domain-containing protein [uncultured Shewanella sp.]